ncbi:hypothetical protein CDL12_13250 [Handroanthus impetiginosus]|uniref:Uncharacterized protein n=1 Tax=Handroanthus impetiginosus TaxID=429701 RepID=A0A2G9H9D0_9LAMI|nr:hypothetical protein CDL12_13250 [Handroanthus impetiginosus]
MSIPKPVVAIGYPPTLHIKPSHRSFDIIKHQNPFLGKRSLKFLDNIRRVQKNDTRKRSFVVYNVVQPEVPPPSGPPFNVL